MVLFMYLQLPSNYCLTELLQTTSHLSQTNKQTKTTCAYHPNPTANIKYFHPLARMLLFWITSTDTRNNLNERAWPSPRMKYVLMEIQATSCCSHLSLLWPVGKK